MKTMRSLLLLSGCTLATALLFLAQAYAFDCRPQLLPNGSVNGCGNCHIDEGGGGPRNEFGEDVDDFAIGCAFFWEPELALMDSDGDGRTNGEELGDPEGTWTEEDPQPGDPSDVTNPGVFDEFPTQGFVRGDSNADGAVDISDAIGTLGFLFLGDPDPPCRAASDSNADGVTDITDAVYVLGFLFTGGAAPPQPFPGCGEEPSILGCDEFPPCG